jgi:hypothetical protein
VTQRASYVMERKLGRATSLQLADRLIRAVRSDEHLRTSWQWDLPLISHGRDWKLERHSREFRAIHSELVRRYVGMLSQLLAHSLGRANVENAWPDFGAGLGMRVRTAIRMVDDPRPFSVILWRETMAQIASQNGSVAACAFLRPKFMLRQFVEEVRKPDLREVLSHAYDENYIRSPDLREVQNLREGCAALREVVQHYKGDLNLRVDGTLEPDAYAELYVDWLYPTLN